VRRLTPKSLTEIKASAFPMNRNEPHLEKMTTSSVVLDLDQASCEPAVAGSQLEKPTAHLS